MPWSIKKSRREKLLIVSIEEGFLVCSHLCLFLVYAFENLADRGNVEQVQAPDQSNQDKSFHNQNMCNKEGLQKDKT